MTKFAYNREGTHMTIIQEMCKQLTPNNYLELGIYDGKNITAISNLGIDSYGVDISDKIINKNFNFIHSNTDDFFKNNIMYFDVIFIDADHKYLSVVNDLENSLKILSKHGIIFLHDTDPSDAFLLNDGYCSDSYKIVDYIEDKYKDTLDLITLPFSNAGLSIITRKADKRINNFNL